MRRRPHLPALAALGAAASFAAVVAFNRCTPTGDAVAVGFLATTTVLVGLALGAGWVRSRRAQGLETRGADLVVVLLGTILGTAFVSGIAWLIGLVVSFEQCFFAGPRVRGG